MLKFANGGILVSTVSELPNLVGAKHVYLDYETTSGHPKVTSLNPWKACGIAGACITVDNSPNAWYVPIGHNDSDWNLPGEPVKRWLTDILKNCEEWRNHNVKYDIHAGNNNGVPYDGRAVCTLTAAKIIDSDRITRGGYSLDALSAGWLKRDIHGYEQRVKAWLKGCRSKDYGDVPADIMGEYGCQDVFTARELYKYIDHHMPDQCREVWETEIQLTRVLVDMETEGLHVDLQELQIAELQIMHLLIQLEEWFHKHTGIVMRPHTNEDCYELLCANCGLPVLAYTDKGEPSFDKHALTSYLAHPQVTTDERLKTYVEKIKLYRENHTTLGFFIKPYQEKQVNGLLHPEYNQAVRTGRMSSKNPNAQQLNTRAKTFIHPKPGYTFVSLDYSQVEFRLIVHFIKNLSAIRAYEKDPRTDFHVWVAEMCGIPRKPAKNVNFAIGYSGGKAKILHMLSSNMELVGNLMEKSNGDQGLFEALCKQHAEQVYRRYHATLPELKRTSFRASQRLKQRGYIFNAYGRHRHMPEKAAFRSFNNIVQSTAADLMKERTVACSPRHDSFVRDHDITQVASVHDETLFQMPTEVAQDDAVIQHLVDVMESPSREFRVPIKVDVSIKKTSWAT